ncbi:MAG TPA: multiheme c-type cytochrome [Polyangiaceae bacterium]|nr:multiheme c-type cytochrome [Polyangiaceae bacterium]
MRFRAKLGVAILLAGSACVARGPGSFDAEISRPAEPFSISKTTQEAEPPEPLGPMPGPRRRRGEAAVAQNAACEGCHEDVAREWRGSLHQRSNIEPAYQRAFAIEPMRFCQGCHAPESDVDSDPTPDVSALGVGCVTCHVTSEGILAAPRAASTETEVAPARGSTPHAVVRDPRFSSGAACASCHEFPFPDAGVRGSIELMQSTHTEHARSPFAETSCAGCHMPAVSAGGGRARRSHAFAASRDPAILRNSVRVEAQRTGPTTVRITLTPQGVGHALPTGDLFRRIEVLAEALGPDNLVKGRAARYLTRRFRVERRSPGVALRILERDERLGLNGDASTVVDLDAGELAAGAPIAWSVTYQRVEHPRSVGEDDALIEGEIPLAHGIEQPVRGAPPPEKKKKSK